ncbi:MAG: BTAD domain-containing putative transcriptional regulator [Bacillota bacterium]
MGTTHPPSLPGPHVPRPHLVQRALQHRITLLVAPAGYGKSSLLAEVMRSSPGRFGWHQLTEADRMSDRLLEHLAAALMAPRPWRGGVAALCQWAAEQGRPAGLVLDGVEQLAGAAEALNLLGALLSAAPPALRLLLAGRALPEIPGLARLRLSPEVAEIGARELLFTEAESAAYLSQAASGSAAGELAGGWPAALRFLGRLHEPDWTEFRGYLESEVEADLPPEERRWLRDLAVLTEWSPQGCSRILDRTDGERLLRGWERRLPVDRQGRVHGLVQRYFAAQLSAEPERARALHRRAALWQAERGGLKEALGHALAAEDLGLSIPLLRQVGFHLLAEGQLAALETALDRVAAPVLERVPELLLHLGEALRRSGSPRQAGRWLRSAALGFAAEGDGGGLYRAFCRLALTHADLGEWSEMHAALQQIEAEVEGAAGRDRAEALRALGEYQLYLGQGEAAAAHFRESASLFLAHGDEEGAGAALIGLGAGALVTLGRLECALTALRDAQRLVGGSAACDALLAEVQILICLGQWVEAEVALQGATPGSRQQRALIAWLEARLALQRGDPEAAKRLKAEGDHLAATAEQRPVHRGPAALAGGWIALAEGRTAEALASGKQVIRLTSGGFPLLRLSAVRLLEAAEERVRRAGEAAGARTAGDRLRVECLGAFRLFHAEREVPISHWGRAQVRAVLQYLLLQPGFVAPRESLLEVFWPGEPPSQSRSRLRVALNRLRQALQPLGCSLEAGTEVIRLPRESIAEVDLLSFRLQLKSARELVRADPESALHHCRTAQAIYRGPLLADAFWPGLEEYRQLVHREFVALLQLWHEAALRANRTEEAIAALDHLLRLEPGDEEVACRLMRLLIQSGRRGDALRRYRQLARWLREELGIDPSAQTQALFRQALD